MLYISRKENDSVYINDSIEIIVHKISKNQVKIGFKILKDNEHHQIFRKELYEKIQNENKKAITIKASEFEDYLNNSQDIQSNQGHKND